MPDFLTIYLPMFSTYDVITCVYASHCQCCTRSDQNVHTNHNNLFIFSVMILAMAASLGLPASSIEVLTNTLTANSGVSAGIIIHNVHFDDCMYCVHLYVCTMLFYVHCVSLPCHTQYWCIQVTGHITGWEVMNNSSD